MAAICNVVSRATVAPKVSVRAKNTSARAFMGRTAPLKAQVAGASPPEAPDPPRRMLFPPGRRRPPTRRRRRRPFP